MAAMSTGITSGEHPAITALTATFSTVAGAFIGGSSLTTWSADSPEAATAAATRSGVGGTIGSPSVMPRSRR